MAADDIYQIIGFLLEAKDLATPVMHHAQETLAVVAPQMEKLFAGTVLGVEGALGKFADGVLVIDKAIQNATHDFVTGPMEVAVHAVADFADSIGKSMESAVASVMAFPGKVSAAMKAVGTSLTNTGRSFIDFFKGITTGVANADLAIRTKLSSGFDIVKMRISGAAVQLGDFLKKGLSVEKVGSALKTFFSGFSVLLGPIGLIGKLLSPLLTMVEKALTPAFETFSDILENAFAPLSFVAETVARDLAPLLGKFLTPLVNVLTVVLAKAGTFVAKLLDTGKAGGAVAGIFGKIAPIISKVFDALGGLAAKIMPILGKLFEALLPVVEKVVETLGNLAAKVIPVIGTIVEKVGPIVIDIFTGIFDAVEPLIDPLVHLGTVLLEKVFAPLLISALTGVLRLIQKIIPYIQEGVPVVAQLIEDIATQVGDFFDNFDKYMKEFGEAFAPEIQMLKDFGTAAGNAFGWVLDKLQPLIDGVKKLFSLFGDSDAEKAQKVIDQGAASSLGKGVNPDELAAAQVTSASIDREYADRIAKGLPTTDLQAKRRGAKPPMAEGGIIERPTEVLAGEKGREAITPLKPEVFSAMLPGLDEAVQYLKVIARAVTGTLNTRSADGGMATASPGRSAQPPSDLGGAVGITGLSVVRA